MHFLHVLKKVVANMWLNGATKVVWDIHQHIYIHFTDSMFVLMLLKTIPSQTVQLVNYYSNGRKSYQNLSGGDTEVIRPLKSLNLTLAFSFWSLYSSFSCVHFEDYLDEQKV